MRSVVGIRSTALSEMIRKGMWQSRPAISRGEEMNKAKVVGGKEEEEGEEDDVLDDGERGNRNRGCPQARERIIAQTMGHLYLSHSS